MMNSIAIGWKKRISGEVQFSPYVQHSALKTKNQANKTTKKKVLFNVVEPTVHQDAFQWTDQIRSQRLYSKDHDDASSSSNMFTAELPTINDKRICSTRAAVITFIIVILIIIAAAIAIGVTFASINSQQNNTSRTTTGSNNQNLFSTGSTTVVVSSISIGSQSGAPCSSYTTINDPSRNIAQMISHMPCDNGPLFNTSNGGSWIRFVGSGGTIIPLTSPGMNRCGGYLSGWSNRTLPTTVNNTKSGQACFDSEQYSCLFHTDISVTNCGGFYVYFLPSVPTCNARYCTT